MGSKKNHLDKEKSPYLLQHKDNPVWWYPWSDEAFTAAKKEDKPIFLSIGYATCHWCHVMEGDSFENESVAKILNEHFISIKVDREEHPDIDAIYMAAVQAMTGSGGWPMSLFLTPDLKPFFGATFIPRDKFIQTLNHVAKSWKSPEKEKILASSKGVLEHLKKISLGELSPDNKKVNEQIIKEFFNNRIQSFDKEFGGFGGAPKFPSPMGIKTLFRIYKRSNEPKALNMALETLNKMSRGGIYDHLGGGFHRYSTDKIWLTPHFEKMLYDNALLISTYTEAFQITSNREYEYIVKDSINYLLRDMQNKEGGFFTAEDADSEKAEGKFYIWHYKELQKVLSKSELKIIEDTYGVTKNGNFDTGEFSSIEESAGLKGIHKGNILFLNKDYKLPDYEKNIPLQKIKEKLFAIRVKRVRPLLDTKILTAWNGLTISSLAKASRVFNEPLYLQAAQNSANFIIKHLYKNQSLLRRYASGHSAINGTLNDYAFFIDALLELYQADFDVKWFNLASTLQKKQDELFWDIKDSGYFNSAINSKNLIMRQKDFYDNAIPSGNAVSCLNLLRFADFTYEESYKKKATQILSYVSGKMTEFPAAFPELISALDYYLDTSKEVAIIGVLDTVEAKNIIKMINKEFLPNKIIGFGAENLDKKQSIPLLKNRPMINSKATIYVCENKTCKLPTTEASKALNFINNIKELSLK